jgi:ribosomal protein L11 methylase PrmA
MPRKNSSVSIHPASFRDPSGFVFERDGILYRQVNQSYQEDFRQLMSSGLYAELASSGALIAHQEVSIPPPVPAIAYKIIQPQRIPFLSYPQEWSFGQLQDAALLLLQIQTVALNHGMILKDASAYNVQYINGRPVLIDTLSFERRTEGTPWIAYRQFCEHFLAPLALRSIVDGRLLNLQAARTDGIPLDLTAKLLPWKAKIKRGLLLHIYLHSAFQRRFEDSPAGSRRSTVSLPALLELTRSLELSVSKLRCPLSRGPWSSYYETCTYTSADAAAKQDFVRRHTSRPSVRTVWDIGANTGTYSKIASSLGSFVVAADSDPQCVEQLYRKCVAEGEKKILPLIVDLSNPTPSIGWDNLERESFLGRGSTDMIYALALMHHLAIANNLPFTRIAAAFSRKARYLITEFVPKTDPQVQRLLRSRRDIFELYSQEGFESSFGNYFRTLGTEVLSESGRILYAMESLTISRDATALDT